MLSSQRIDRVRRAQCSSGARSKSKIQILKNRKFKKIENSKNQKFKLSQQDQQTFLSDPQQLNSYSYGRNNPITQKDPGGNSGVAALPFLLPEEVLGSFIAPQVAIPVLIGTAAAIIYNGSDVSLRNSPGYRWEPFDPRRLPPSSMLGPQNILDPFGGGPPNFNPKTPNWVKIGTIGVLGTLAAQEFVDPFDKLQTFIRSYCPRSEMAAWCRRRPIVGVRSQSL
jgi:hypothetical protein